MSTRMIIPTHGPGLFGAKRLGKVEKLACLAAFGTRETLNVGERFF